MNNMAYEPEPRDWEQKSWLYEQYWGKKLGSSEISDKVGISGHTIRKKLTELGIPRRVAGYERDNNISPFTGFYSGNVNSQTDELTHEASKSEFDSEKRGDVSDIDWSDFGPERLKYAE